MQTRPFLTWPSLAAALGTALVGTMAFAKLPAPGPEAQAKTAEAAAKAAHAGKVDGYQLCLAQDKVAAQYRKATPQAKPAGATAACTDPGPFVYTPPAAPAAAAPLPAPAGAPATPAAPPAKP
ncbi:MAG: hypothetical protein PHI55_01565 [Burkholderiaceae bacterium]|nr:hypothetical protein [Burkholderiaceae bacterium]